MRHATLATAILMAILGAGSAAADGDAAAALDAACVRPAWDGELPDPAVATQEEMFEGHRSIKAFDQAVATYGGCLATTETRLVEDGGDPTFVREARSERNDGAVGEAERLATEFNSRLRMWRERQQAPMAVPPEILGFTDPRAAGGCYAAELRRSGTEIRASVTLAVDAEGKARVKEWPLGVSEGYKKTVLCLLKLLRISPGTLDGHPVPSEATLPVALSLYDTPGMPIRTRFEPPVAISTPEELRQAQAECAPAEFRGHGEPGVEVKVSAAGKVSGIRIVQSSGDPAVDRVAECIIGKTRFAPGTRNGAARHMTMTTTVRIGTPASALRGAGPPPATGTTPP
jgi:TonB family protein